MELKEAITNVITHADGSTSKSAELTVDEVLDLRAKFKQRADADRTHDLGKESFKALIRHLIVERGEHEVPSNRDLDAAFIIADEDNSGMVDEVRFGWLLSPAPNVFNSAAWCFDFL